MDRWLDLRFGIAQKCMIQMSMIVGEILWVLGHELWYFIWPATASSHFKETLMSPEILKYTTQVYIGVFVPKDGSKKTTIGETAKSKSKMYMVFPCPPAAGATEPPGSPRCATSRPYLARSWPGNGGRYGHGMDIFSPTKWALQPANHKDSIQKW